MSRLGVLNPGMQIIEQPNKRFCIYCRIRRDFILEDASPEEVTEFFVQEAIHKAREDVERVVSSLVKGGKPYWQFTLPYEKALELVEARWADGQQVD